SSAYVKRRGKPKSVEDLASHECLLFRARDGAAAWRLNGPHGEETVGVRGVVVADEFSFLQRAIAAGAGIGILPVFLCKGQDGAGCVRLLPEHSVEVGTIYVVIPSSRHEPARVALFRDFLVTSLREVAWSG